MSVVGILGGGQLGRMLALAGYPLGLRFRVLDPAAEVPAEHLAERVAAGFEDYDALAAFARGLDVLTYEFENVPVATAQFLARFLPVYPPPQGLAVSQDRLTEKTFFQGLGIPVPPFVAVDSWADLDAGLKAVGFPAVLKTRRMGYDGKGQRVLRQQAEVGPAWEALGKTDLILEGFVPFDRELSVLAVRGPSGETAFYPLVENYHQGGILRLSLAPAPHLPPGLQRRAEDHAGRVMDALGYVGVLALELFQCGEQLLANEMAPRVHNSGHWTIEGAETSQFENHLRAVLGLPLGSPAAFGCSAMVNLIGTPPDPAAVLAMSGAHLHLYDKEPRPRRKLGHITLHAADPETLGLRLARLRTLDPTLAWEDAAPGSTAVQPAGGITSEARG